MKLSRELDLQVMDKLCFPKTWEVLEAGLRDGVAPGFVLGLWQTGDPDKIKVLALGERRKIPSSLPMLAETVFDLASVTKIFSTVTLTALLVQRGWLRWDNYISDFFTGYPHSGIQIRHLLSHTAGFPAWFPFWENLRKTFEPKLLHKIPVEARQKEMRKLVFAVAPEVAVDERALYSDISFLLLGFILEEILDMPLDKAVEVYVWEALGISNSFYARTTKDVKHGVMEKVAATENCPWRGGVLQGQVHDDNTWAMGGYAGHAGTFAPVRDVLHFARQLYSGHFFSREILKKIWMANKGISVPTSERGAALEKTYRFCKDTRMDIRDEQPPFVYPDDTFYYVCYQTLKSYYEYFEHHHGVKIWGN